jgi:hypothetical protein
MIRCLAIVAAVLCLAGCFVFDNPFDTGSRAAITFQIVVSGGSQPGTYMWDSQTSAFEMMSGSLRNYIYMDGTGYWRLADSVGGLRTSSILPYGALPPTTYSGWSPADQLSSIDDSEGGISGPSGYPDITVSHGQTLSVGFHNADPGALVTYQWQQSSSQNGTSATTIGTASTCTPAAAGWVRVIVTPTDGSWKHGTPAVSPPVYVN